MGGNAVDGEVRMGQVDGVKATSLVGRPKRRGAVGGGEGEGERERGSGADWTLSFCNF